MRAAFAIASAIFAVIAVPATAQQPAPAQQPAQPTVQRVSGTVTAASATSVTVQDASGKAVTIAVTPDVTVAQTKPIAAQDIKAGDFVATGNATIGENRGRSTELRVMAPGVRLGEGNRAMPQPNMMMTHGDVVAIKESPEGRDLLVRFPGGERSIVVPSDARVTGQTKLTMADLKPGMSVMVILTPDSAAAPKSSYIMINQPRP